MDPDSLDPLERVPHGGVSDPRVLDFSANTNPDIPEDVVPVYDSAFSSSRTYPPDDYCEFRTAAADYVGCEPREVIPSAGALPGIRLAMGVVLTPGDSALLPAPSFGEYEHEVRLQGAEPTFRPHDELFASNPVDHELVVVCNPNNPTGDAYSTPDLEAFCDRCAEAGTTVLVDEAFLDFTDRGSMAGRENVVVARSLTKVFGLPGIRAGFLVAVGDLRDKLDVARTAWTLSTPAAAVGAHCLEQREFVEETRRRVESERERMRERLAERFDVHPSDAPFLLLDVGSADVDDVLDEARRSNVALRDARTFRGLDSHVRVAVKRPDQNDRLLSALGV